MSATAQDLAAIDRIQAAMLAGAEAEIGASRVPGVGWRVFWGAGGTHFTFEAEAARKFAASFDVAEAQEMGLGYMADLLRLAADVCEAKEAQLQ